MYEYWVMEMMEAHHQQSLTMQMKQRRLGFGNGHISASKTGPSRSGDIARLTPNGVRLGGSYKKSAPKNGIHKSRSSAKNFNERAETQIQEVRLPRLNCSAVLFQNSMVLSLGLV